MKKVQLFEAFVAENEKETAREIFDELIDVNGEEIADIDSQEAMTILSRRGIRGGKANKIAKELLKLTSAIGESVVESVVNESDAALKKEIKEAKKELKELQKDYSDISDECKDLRSEIVDLKNDVKTHEQDKDDDMADMAGEQLEEKEDELELRLNDLDQCKMDLDEVKDWLKNPS